MIDKILRNPSSLTKARVGYKIIRLQMRTKNNRTKNHNSVGTISRNSNIPILSIHSHKTHWSTISNSTILKTSCFSRHLLCSDKTSEKQIDNIYLTLNIPSILFCYKKFPNYNPKWKLKFNGTIIFLPSKKKKHKELFVNFSSYFFI